MLIVAYYFFNLIIDFVIMKWLVNEFLLHVSTVVQIQWAACRVLEYPRVAMGLRALSATSILFLVLVVGRQVHHHFLTCQSSPHLQTERAKVIPCHSQVRCQASSPTVSMPVCLHSIVPSAASPCQWSRRLKSDLSYLCMKILQFKSIVWIIFIQFWIIMIFISFEKWKHSL